MLNPATPRYRRLLALCWAALCLQAGAGVPDPRYTGTLPVQEWTPEETGGMPQSFSVLPHPVTGLVYVGNEAGLLEYDGARWRRLPTPAGMEAGNKAVRGLAWDDQGRLWVGMDNELAIYAPDAAGNWSTRTVRREQPAGAPEFGLVWEVNFHDGFVWGTTTQGLLRVDARTLATRVWPMPDNPSFLGLVDGVPWFRRAGHQLFRVIAGEPVPVPVPDLPAGSLALGLVRTGTGVLQAEHAGGVFELRGEQWLPLGSELAAALQGGGAASRVQRFVDGRRVFNTRARTLVMADAAGRVLGRISEPPGVNFGVTPRTCLDRDGGLWLANASGIRRAQLDHAAVRHGPGQGLRGGARALEFAGETMLVASAQGLFLRDAATGQFTYQTGSPADGQDLMASPAGGWLMSAGQRFGEWQAGAMLNAPGEPRDGIVLASDPADAERVFVGTFNRVRVLRRTASAWRDEAELAGLGATIFGLACDARGVLWLSVAVGRGVWRAETPAGDWSRAVLERPERRKQDPLPDVPWGLTLIDGSVRLFGQRGVWHEHLPGGRLEPDAQFAGLPLGAATPVLRLRTGQRPGVIYVAGAGDYRDRFWRGTRDRPEAAWTFTELRLPEVRGQVRFTTFAESPDGRTLWIGGVEAAISVDLEAVGKEFPVPEARWRGVRGLQEADYYYSGAAPRERLTLPLAARAVALDFSAPALRTGVNARTGLEYRTRVVGMDRDWTTWSATATRELTNLPPGDVQLEVQARNLLGVAGPVATLVLGVPPFWWETWWARTLVVLAAAGLVALVVRGIVRRQFQQRIALLEAQAALQQERLRIARDMHDDLGSTLASIVHLSDGTASGEAGPALARVHAAARDLVQRTRDLVWAATPQHDSLESLIEQMAAHAERVLGDRGIAVQVGLPPPLPQEAVASAARHDVFLAFKEAVNNAAKYSSARHAVVSFALQPDSLRVELRDDGVGFAPGEVRGSGHGLGNLRARLAALGGSAEITSEPGRGTTVVLTVPRGPRVGTP